MNVDRGTRPGAPYDGGGGGDGGDGVEYEEFPAPRRGRWLRVAAAVAALGVVIAGVGLVWVLRQVNPPGAPGEEISVEIPQGASTARIVAILEQEGVIASGTVFRLYLRVNGGGPWQAGSYRLRRSSDMGEVVRLLDRGPEIAFTKLTIPEGFVLEQVAARVGQLPGRSAERFLELARSGTVRSQFQPAATTSLEGLLFPDTYVFDEREDEEQVLARMVATFDQIGTQLGLPDAEERVGLTPYEAVIVASMIEREARVPAERAKVARVIYNRLEKRMRLGIDATIRYELDKPSGPLFKSELERDSPYNTRTRAGLPPTPIASPGRASIEAALNPEPGPWLYYVIADADGRHAFATTDAEFQRAKAAAKAKGLL